MGKIGAVILAAGGSSRLGRPKQFLEHEGSTLLGRAVAAASGCSPIIVVAGRDYPRIQMELQSTGVTVIHHADWERGIGSSIRGGVSKAQELDSDLQGIVMLVCDQPFVTEEIIAALRLRRELEWKPVIAASYAGHLGTPALFDRSLFPALLSLADACGARQIIARLGDDATGFPFPRGEIDIDTPADAEAFLQ